MRIEYNRAVDVAYIYLAKIEFGEVATTVPGWPDTEAFGINLDFDKDGRLLRIEVEEASAKLPSEFLARFANRNAKPS